MRLSDINIVYKSITLTLDRTRRRHPQITLLLFYYKEIYSISDVAVVAVFKTIPVTLRKHLLEILTARRIHWMGCINFDGFVTALRHHQQQ